MDARFFESLQLQIKIKKKKSTSSRSMRALKRVTIIPIDYIARSVIARE